MKQAGMCLLFCLFSLAAIVEGRAQSPSPSAALFAGTWVFDRANTNTSKDFPHKMKNYKITVAENETTLNVRSVVEGPLEIEINRDRSSSPNSAEIVSNTASRSSTRPAGGAVSGNTLGSTPTETINYGGTMALFFTPVEANYKLSGEEEKVPIKQGIVRMKVKIDKKGNQIQFTTIRRMNTMKGDLEITVREVWKLSKDGKSMRFERTVETPTARDEIVMTFMRAEA